MAQAAVSKPNKTSSAENPLLKFGTNGNAKLGKGVWHFSISSGSTCPGASICKAWVSVRKDGDTLKRTLHEGKDAQLRCFSASQEIAFPSVHKNRSDNLKKLKAAGSTENMAQLIRGSLPELVSLVRVHIGGDFFSQEYFDAWMQVAATRPATRFYAYTKSIPFWLNWLGRHRKLPSNFKLVASMGGKFDHLVDKKRMCYAVIVFHPDEAKALGLPIEKDDDAMAQRAEHPFALVLHNVQPKGTPAAEAIKRMRAEGVEFGYKRTD
jgi:hypothetical protein